MIQCLTAIRFNMKADILRPGKENTITNTFVADTKDGDWVTRQDPDSGEIVRKWQAATQVDNPSTPEYEGLETVSCIARGIIDGGIRVAGTTERFGETYQNIDYVSMTVGPKAKITKRDRITNIRNNKNIIIWKDEERDGSPATVFEVLGVTPVPDPYGNLIEQKVMLTRAEIE